MSKSDIVFNVQYKTPRAKGKAIARWINYVTDKNKADDSSIDEYNVLKDYALFTNKDMYLTEKDETYLWNKNGDVLKKDAIDKLKPLEDKGTFLRGFLSFPQDFAINHGLITKSDYYSLSNNVITKFIADMGLDINNVEWYCGLHRNTPSHPHIHFCIYEKKETKKELKAPLFAINNFKSNVAKYLVDYEKFYKLRDNTLNDITKNINMKELSKVKSQRLFGDKYRKQLNDMLLSLYSKLPKTGRLQYNSKNLRILKSDIDEIIEFILTHNSLRYQYAKYIRLLNEHQKELNTLYGMSESNKNRKYFNDQKNKLYTKIGNEILHNFKVYQSMSFFDKEKDFLRKYIMDFNFKSRNYKRNETIISIAKDLYQICSLADLNDRQIKKVFQRWIKNSNYKINVDSLLASITTTNKEMSTQDLYKALNRLGYSSERYNKLRTKNFYRQLDYKRFVDSAISHLMYELEKEEKEIINNLEFELG